MLGLGGTIDTFVLGPYAEDKLEDTAWPGPAVVELTPGLTRAFPPRHCWLGLPSVNRNLLI